MTPVRFAQCRDVLPFNRSQLARLLGRGEATLRQWERGVVRIPDADADWIERTTRFFLKNPPPGLT